MSVRPGHERKLRGGVLDASSLVRAAPTPRSAARRLTNAVLARGLPVASAPVFEEVEGVIARPKFERWLSEADRIGFMRQIRSGAVVQQPAHVVRACRDPSDDKYLEAALAAVDQAAGPEAVLIASDDRDLLVPHPWRGIAILKPEAALALLGDG